MTLTVIVNESMIKALGQGDQIGRISPIGALFLLGSYNENIANGVQIF
jgi:hypothetical protein